MTRPTCGDCQRFKSYPETVKGECCAGPPDWWGRPAVEQPDPACRWFHAYPVPRSPRKCDFCRAVDRYEAGETECRTCHKPLIFQQHPPTS